MSLPCSRGTRRLGDAASDMPFFRNLQPSTALHNSTHMLSTLSNGLGSLAQAQLGRAALCAALPLLQRVASTAAAAGIHEAAAPSAAGAAAGLHEAAAAAAHHKHHKPAHKKKDFSIAPFLAKPGQGRRASGDAVEWNDRWGLNRAAVSASLLTGTLPPLVAPPPCGLSTHAVFPCPALLAPHGQPTADTTLMTRPPQAAPPRLWAAPRPALRPKRGRRLALQADCLGASRLPAQPPR